MNSFIPTIERIFQEELSPELIQKVMNSSSKDLLRVSDEYNQVFENQPFYLDVPKKEGELVPYSPSTFNDWNQELRNGLGIKPHDFHSIDNVWNAIDNIKLRLIYCHSIVIDDPGNMIMDAVGLGEDHSPYWYNDKKNQFVNYLNFILNLKPLLDSGIVTLLPKKAIRDSVPGFSGKRDWSKINGLDFTSLKRRLESRNSNLVKSGLPWDELLCTMAEVNLNSTAQASLNLGVELDYFLPDPFWHQILSVLVSEANNCLSVEPQNEVDSMRLLSLANLQVPNLDLLTQQDIVSVRNDEDVFEKWRLNLAKALSNVQAKSSAFIDQDKAALKILQEEMKEAQDELKSDIKKSSLKSKFSTGTKTFAVGATTAALTMQQTGDLKLAAVSSAISAVAELVFNLKKKKPDKAVLNHYLSIQ